MFGQMTGGGNTYNIRNNAGTWGPGISNSNEAYYRWLEEMQRQNRVQPGSTQGGGAAEDVIRGIFGGGGADAAGRLGSGYGPMRGDDMGGRGGAPRGMGTSMFPGYSYKTRGSAPDYHREMPYGGTPGVWAIRNDEIAGPRGGDWSGLARQMRDRNRARFGFRR